MRQPLPFWGIIKRIKEGLKMEVEDVDVDVMETPLMQAVREEVTSVTPMERHRRADDEAEMLTDDIDDFVAENDPESLPAAEAEIDAWQAPVEPRLTGDGRPPVSIFSAGTEPEANIVRGLLEAEGIPVVVSMAGTAAYGTMLSIGAGKWGDLFVSPDDAERAREIIAAQESST
jgi:hypothetical protein